MIYFLSLFLITTSTFGDTVELANNGLGLETLMSGVGQARAGSEGSLTSNPALLAFLPQKEEFFSTNAILNYRFRENSDNSSISQKLDVIPIYAATVEGHKDWGMGYGLSVRKFQTRISRSDEFNVKADSSNQDIQAMLGAGKKISPDSGFGMTFFLQRSTLDSEAKFTSIIGGNSFIGFSESNSVYWSSAASLGYFKRFSQWAFGVSAKLNLFTFGSKKTEETVQMIAPSNEISRDKKISVPHISVKPGYALGVRRSFLQTRLYFDYNFSSKYVDEGSNFSSANALSSGIERRISSAYIFYSGLRYDFKRNISNQSDEEAKGNLSLGFSKQGKHSMNFMGINWNRGIQRPGNEVHALFFGTKFEY